VRPWLVVVGIVFLTLAAGTLATLYLAGDGPPNVVTVPTVYPTFVLASHEGTTLPFSGPNGTPERFTFSWQSSGPIGVLLEERRSCSAPCVNPIVLDNWSSQLSGSWTGSGPFDYPLLCVLQNPSDQPANVSMDGRAVAMMPTHLSLLFDVLVGAGAAALLVVGGLAVFLGLFLRGDPYGPPSPLAPRSADDVEELTQDEPLVH
jgi:hypothetical protein